MGWENLFKINWSTKDIMGINGKQLSAIQCLKYKLDIFEN